MSDQPTIIIKDPTKADTKQVAEMIKSILDAMKEAHKSLYKEIEGVSKEDKEKIKEVKAEMKESERNLKGLIAELKTGSSSDTKDLSKRLNEEVKNLYQAIDDIPQFNSSEIENRFAVMIGELGKKLSAIKELGAEEIRDSLESLKGDTRLDKSAIKGLEEELKKIETGGSGRNVGSFFAKRIFWQQKNLTGTIDGVNTVFTFEGKEPAQYSDRIFLNYIEQNPLTDYTIAGKTITYTVAPDISLSGSSHIIRSAY